MSGGKKIEVDCEHCKHPFLARQSDRNRGWSRFCSKSCKALAQEKRTGQMSKYLRGEHRSPSRVSMSREDRYQSLCDAHCEGRISDEYYYMILRDHYSDFMDSCDEVDAYHFLDVHPFSTEGLGQD